MPIGCHSAKMAPLTSGSTLDLSHPTVSCCILHWGFLAFCVIRQQQKKMVLTQLYVEAMCIVESLYSISESLIFFCFLTRRELTSLLWLHVGFSSTAQCYHFFFMYQILVIQYTRTKHWFLYTVYHFSRYCVWIKLSPDFRPVRSETVWSQTPSSTPPWNCPWPTHLSFNRFVFVANSDLGFCVWGADFEVTSVTGYC